MPVLKPDSRHNLLTQGFRAKSSPESLACFGKILFTAKKFVRYARDHKVYRLHMHIHWPNPTYFFLSYINDRSCRTKSFELSYEQAQMFIKFLNPAFFEADVDYVEEDYDADFLNLLDFSTGDIGFRINNWRHSISLPYIQKHWKRIKELPIRAHLLLSSKLMPPKHFDVLKVLQIFTIGQLKRALKHSAKQITLSMFYEFPRDDLADDANWFKNIDFVEGIELGEAQKGNPTRTESLKLEFTSFSTNNNYEMVMQTTFDAYPKLKQFEVSFCPDWEYAHLVDHYENNTISEIFDAYTAYVRVRNFLQQIHVPTLLIANVSLSSRDRYVLPPDWRERMLDNHPVLRDLSFETKESEDGVVTTHIWNVSEYGNGKAIFHVNLRYRYEEVVDAEDVPGDDEVMDAESVSGDEDPMNAEDVSSDEDSMNVESVSSDEDSMDD